VNGLRAPLLLLLFVGGALDVRDAWAGAPKDHATDSKGAAESLFEAGRGAMARGNYEEACAKFEASNQLDPAVGTVLNLANCNEQRGRRALALEQFREVAARLPSGDPRRPVALERLARLEAGVPRIALRLSHTAPAGAIVILDGTVLPPQSLDALLPIDVGDHLVLVRASGRQERQYELNLADGQRVELALDAGAANQSSAVPPAAVTGQPARTEAGRPKETHPPVAGYVVGGIGLVALGASLTTGILALSKEKSLDGQCENKPSGGGRYCTPDGLATADTGHTLAIVSDVTLGIGLAGVAAGAWLLFFHKETGTVSASATPVRGGATLDLRGTL
jgi:hypothetical protein